MRHQTIIRHLAVVAAGKTLHLQHTGTESLSEIGGEQVGYRLTLLLATHLSAFLSRSLRLRTRAEHRCEQHSVSDRPASVR